MGYRDRRRIRLARQVRRKPKTGVNRMDNEIQREIDEYWESGEFFDNMDADEIEDWYEDGAD